MLDALYGVPFRKYCIDFLLKVPGVNKLHPNWITLASLLTGLLVPILLYFDSVVMALIMMGLSFFGDVLDGSMARAQGRTSPLGGVFDIVSDRAVEFAIILGFFLQDEQRALYCLLMLGSILVCVSSFLVVGIYTPNESNKGFYYSPGLIERAEAAVFFTGMMLFPAHFNTLSLLFVALVVLTILIRLGQFALNLQEETD